MFFRSPRAQVQGDRSPWGNFWFSPTPTGFVTPEKSLALTSVYACVKVLAESFACMPFNLYQPNAAGTKRKKVTKHWAVRLFTKAPNKFQTPFEFRLMLQSHLALRGNAYCQIRGNSRGEIIELLPLHPDRMSIDTLDGGNYRYKYTTEAGETIYYTRGEIWHLRGLSSDGYMGLSPIEQCRAAVTEGLSMQAYSNRFYENDAKPGGGWIESPVSFANSADKQEFRDSWQKLQGGINRGKVAVLEKGMKFHELSVSNSDSQFIEARAAKVSDIARIFRVPPHKIGDLARSTFSNIEQQSMEFWTDTMLPWAEMWESSLEFFLLGEDSGFEAEFDMKRMMRGDSAARSEYYMNGIQWGWLTRNEARAMEGLAPLDDLDDPIVPMNMVPADKLGEEPEPEPDDETDDADKPPAAPVKPAKPAPAPNKPKKAHVILAVDASPALAAIHEQQVALERLAGLVYTNAGRMARRCSAGAPPDAETLADALAISSEAAAEWLANVEPHVVGTHAIHGSLLELAA